MEILGVIRKLFLSFGLLMALAVVPAVAQETAAETDTDLANNTAFGDWVVSCQAATVQRNICQLVQVQTLRDTGQMLARFVALPVEDGAILLAQMPMGVYLPGGAVYRFAENEEQEQREMIWQRCLGEVCEAAAPLDTDELALFAEHEQILVGFRMSAEDEPIILGVDISQFNEALEALERANTQE